MNNRQITLTLSHQEYMRLASAEERCVALREAVDAAFHQTRNVLIQADIDHLRRILSEAIDHDIRSQRP